MEKIYETCFCYELAKREISFATQKKVPIVYDDVLFEEGLRLNILVDDLIVVELKAQENYHAVWEAQLISYLRLSGNKLGYNKNYGTTH